MQIGYCIQINGQIFRCTSAEFGPHPGEITFHLECREGDAIQMVNLIFNTTEENNGQQDHSAALGRTKEQTRS